MKRRMTLREPRLVHAAVGTMILAGPVSAALAAAPHGAQAAPADSQTLQADVQSRRLAYGQDVIARGHAPSTDAGQTVTLSFEAAGSSTWQQIATSQIGPKGTFRLSAALRNSRAGQGEHIRPRHRPLGRGGRERRLDVA